MEAITESTICCTGCNKDQSESNFTGKNGKTTKTCEHCRDVYMRSKNKNKCEHNRQRSRCKECGGSSICEHNREGKIDYDKRKMMEMEDKRMYKCFVGVEPELVMYLACSCSVYHTCTPCQCFMKFTLQAL